MGERRSPFVVEQIPVRVDELERKRLAQLAERRCADEPLRATGAFGKRVCPGLAEGPRLLLGDPAGLALFEMPGDWALEYRAFLLARDGDALALGVRRNLPFERYCRDVLRLGRPRVLTPEASREPLATRCARDRRVLDALVQLSAHHGRLNIVPYIGTGAVWVLAAQISSLSGAAVRVAAPPPRLTRKVNDKLWFARRVAEVLGPRALPETFSAFEPAALAGRVAALARRYPFVAVKVPDSAGSAGNAVIDSRTLRRLGTGQIRDRLLALLGGRAWSGGYPLLVSVWECPVLVSPSVQLWIPERGQGDPIVEGVFDQSLGDPEGEFIGAAPTTLPEHWQERLAGEAARLGCLLQELDYFGRCSLDAILAGEELRYAELHWVECNARWGGVSIPIALLNRLVGSWRRRPFVVVQRTRLHGPRRPFEWLLERFADRLFRTGESERGIVLLAPGRVEEGSGFDFVALAPDVEGARAEAEAVNAVLLDPSEAP